MLSVLTTEWVHLLTEEALVVKKWEEERGISLVQGQGVEISGKARREKGLFGDSSGGRRGAAQLPSLSWNEKGEQVEDDRDEEEMHNSRAVQPRHVWRAFERLQARVAPVKGRGLFGRDRLLPTNGDLRLVSVRQLGLWRSVCV